MPAISTVRVSVGMAEKLKAATAKLLKREVVVGVPDSTAERQPEPGEPKPPSNALIGYVMEFGDPEKNIPARPFLVPGVENAKPEIIRRMQQSGAAALNGDSNAVDNGLAAVGMVAQNVVRAKITDGPFAPLSDRTIEDRARRGRQGALFEKQRRAKGEAPSTEFARPLIDTGQLRAAITFAVRDRGSD